VASIIAVKASTIVNDVVVEGETSLDSPAADDIAFAIVADFNGIGNLTGVTLDGDAMTFLSQDLSVFNGGFGANLLYKVLDGAEVGTDDFVLTTGSPFYGFVCLVQVRPDSASVPSLGEANSADNDGATNGPLSLAVTGSGGSYDVALGFGFSVIAPRAIPAVSDGSSDWTTTDATAYLDVANDNGYTGMVGVKLSSSGLASVTYNVAAFTANGGDYVTGLTYGVVLGAGAGENPASDNTDFNYPYERLAVSAKALPYQIDTGLLFDLFEELTGGE